MNQRIKEVLNNLNLEAQREFLADYTFQLKGIAVPISIRLYRPLGSDAVEFRQSHFIKTPTQAGPYKTSSSGGEDEADALRRAVQTLTTYYEEAVRAGHEPAEEWLVENDWF